jgi:hypothetical protein
MRAALRFVAIALGLFLLAGAVTMLFVDPRMLVPQRPFSRWLLALVALGVLAGALDAGFDGIWREVGELRGSREPRWIKLIAIGLGLVLSLGALLLVFGLCYLVLGGSAT